MRFIPILITMLIIAILRSVDIYLSKRIRKTIKSKDLERIESIEQLKNKLKDGLILRLVFLAMIPLFFLSLLAILCYIAFFRTALFYIYGSAIAATFFIGGFGCVLLLLIEYYFQLHNSEEVVKIGDEILSRGGSLSSWQEREYRLAKKIVAKNKKGKGGSNI